MTSLRDESALATISPSDQAAEPGRHAMRGRIVQWLGLLFAGLLDLRVLLLLESRHKLEERLLDDLSRLGAGKRVAKELLRRTDRVVSLLADRAAQLEARGREGSDDGEAIDRECDPLPDRNRSNWFWNQ